VDWSGSRSGRREQPLAQLVRQALRDDELAAHKAVGLRVARALKSAARKVAHEMAAHLVDYRLHRLVFAEQGRSLGEANILAAAQRILDLVTTRAIGMRRAASRAERRNGCSKRRST
jgi:hypothetical protein